MHLIALGLITLLPAQTAEAQSGRGLGNDVTGRGTEPTLHLSASATQDVAPDELIADLTAVGNAETAVAAQHRVNVLMVAAAKEAKGASGIKTSFRDYSVQFIDEKPAHWTAQQTLEMRGSDAEALLGLAGRLQAAGLAIASLDWQVSPSRAEQARRAATVDALKNLREEATEAAAALGLEVGDVQAVDLNGPRVFPLPQPAMLMPARMPAPQATPDQQDITATVTGDFMLRPVAGKGGKP